MNCFASLIAWAGTRSGLPVKSLAFVIEPNHVYHEQLVQYLYNSGATVYLVNPGKVRKFAEGIGILSKSDLVDADLLVRYGLLAKKLHAYAPVAQEVNDLRSLLNRLNVLERDLRVSSIVRKSMEKQSFFSDLNNILSRETSSD